MDLRVKTSSSKTEIHIDDTIKSISDNDKIKQAIENSWSNNEHAIDIYINDSFIITSSVIGFLIKFIKKDKMPITIYISNSELYEMLDDMKLIEVLNIRRDVK